MPAEGVIFGEWIQLGFAGFCGVLLWINWRVQERMAKSLEENSRVLLEIVQKNTAALAGQEAAFRERPCMKDMRGTHAVKG